MRIFASIFVVAIASVGCAKAGDSTHKDLAAIQQELGRMRAENAILMARIEALETIRTRQTTSDPNPKSRATGNDDRPTLDVLRLAPTSDASPTTDKPHVSASEQTTQSGEVDQDEPRPVIRSTGRGEVVAQSPRTPKPPSLPSPSRPATTGSGTPR
jgi:hypothetical protein